MSWLVWRIESEKMANITRLHIENLQLAGNKEADNFREMLMSAGISEETTKNALKFLYVEIPNTNYGNACNDAEQGSAQSDVSARGEAYAEKECAGGVVFDASWHNYKIATSVIAGWNAKHKAAQDAVQKALRDAGLGYVQITLRNAAMSAARFTSWPALRGASLDAASDAALIMDYILASDLHFDGHKEYQEYVYACRKAWTEGKVPLGGDVNNKPLNYDRTLVPLRTVEDFAYT